MICSFSFLGMLSFGKLHVVKLIKTRGIRRGIRGIGRGIRRIGRGVRRPRCLVGRARCLVANRSRISSHMGRRLKMK